MDDPRFMFATGIENSNPTIETARARRRDGEVRPLPALARRFRRWCRSWASASCATARRCTRTWLGAGRYDWEFADETFAELQRRDIVPIVDLCHFGVPDWIGNFQNPDFPALFAEYARAFAAALPLGAALHAGQRDVHLRPLLGPLRLVERAADQRPRPSSPRSSTSSRPTCWPCRPSCDVRPDAIFIQSESSEYFHAENPAAIRPGRD